MFEPVEHRWRWGQYFGPLLLAQAAPRSWLEDGKKIEVRDAPTWFGKLSYEIESRAAAGCITAVVRLDSRVEPATILVRLRHPEGKRLRQVTVDGRPWRDFDPDLEWVRLKTGASAYRIVASY